MIRRGPLAGLTLTRRGERLAEALLVLSGSVLGAGALLAYLHLIPALAEWITK